MEMLLSLSFSSLTSILEIKGDSGIPEINSDDLKTRKLLLSSLFKSFKEEMIVVGWVFMPDLSGSVYNLVYLQAK